MLQITGKNCFKKLGQSKKEGPEFPTLTFQILKNNVQTKLRVRVARSLNHRPRLTCGFWVCDKSSDYGIVRIYLINKQ